MEKICLTWTISLLGGIFSLFFISSIGFILGLSINLVWVFLSLIVFFAIFIIFSKKYNFSIKSTIAQLVVLFDILLISGVIYYLLPDCSYDGITYHQASMILMKWGWNPIYDNVLDFMSNQKYQFLESAEFAECFLKFFEIIGANIYLLFNNIEFTRIINVIFAIMAFCYTFYSLRKFDVSSKYAVIFSVVLVYNPVCVYQMLSNYVDGVFYFTFLITLFSLINLSFKRDERISVAIFILVATTFCNVKLTALFTFAVVAFAFAIAYPSKKFFKSLLAIVFLIVLTGVNPYITNVMQHRNPFFPIIKDSVLSANHDYMINSFPPGFESMNRFKKFAISTFGVSKNLSILIPTKDVPRLKIPFTLSNDDVFTQEDMRLGGFGYFFGGILLTALLLSPFIRFKSVEDKKLFWTIIFILIFSVLGNHEAWWARFVPQFYILPILLFLFILKNSQNTEFKNNLAKVMILLCFINSLIINLQYTEAKIILANDDNEHLSGAKDHYIYLTRTQIKKDKRLETLPVKLEDEGYVIVIIED